MSTAEYWSQRAHLRYYQQVEHLIRWSKATTLLDVGANVSGGCEFLRRFPDLQRAAVELEWPPGRRIEGVQLAFSSFEDWIPPAARFDVAVCLQTLEHVSEPEPFLGKLFDVGRMVIISVPFRWPAGSCDGHIHDPVGMIDVLRWAQWREPDWFEIVDGRLVIAWWTDR